MTTKEYQLKTKPLNYYGFAFDKPGEDYNKAYLATDEGKETIKKEKKSRKRLQRQLAKHGVDESEVWNLDITIAKFILPRIKLLRKTTHGYPSTLTPEKWDKVLKQMQTSFKLTATDSVNASTLKKHQRGLKLFAKHYNQLWN